MKNYHRLRPLLGLAVISLFFLWLYLHLDRVKTGSLRTDPVELEAARLMLEAEKFLGGCREARGLSVDSNQFDINRTGLVGLESSPLTTTLGNLSAKRTTTNPNLAALLVYLLRRAGVKPGDRIAVGASGSFPALILASYCAARALRLELLAIVSVGASQWGANEPEFSWLDMEECLRQHGFNQHRLLAAAWGGEDDSGQEYPGELRARLKALANRLGLEFLPPGRLEDRVREHLRLLEQAAGGGRLKAFINIGGSAVNLGQDSSILKLRPGLTRVRKIPPASRRGLIQEMARKEIPVIHLLNIRRLAEIYDLPWDPRPLPPPGATSFSRHRVLEKRELAILLAAYVLVCLVWLGLELFIQRKAGRSGSPPGS
ncbi:MAG: poly-gamma-glutamate system protein [Candidatus Saccharicenans sp.]|jgi:poly-gamma-glutamate system protein|nr:poly-gamma-glutamate system protein [Candidatus Saccharicenans sp.]MDH7492442.1 poly-gamma-glutamate system protein [Candidatus Saccharicenans sp.]